MSIFHVGLTKINLKTATIEHTGHWCGFNVIYYLSSTVASSSMKPGARSTLVILCPGDTSLPDTLSSPTPSGSPGTHY